MKKITLLFAICMMAFSYSAKADKLDDVIKANIKAHGGEKVYKETKTMYAEVEISIMGMNMPKKVWTHTPDKYRVEQYDMGKQSIIVANGKSCWLLSGSYVQELTAEQIILQKNQNPFIDIIGNNPLVDYKAKKTPVSYAGTEVVNGKNCDVLEVKQDSNISIKWFIDQTTNLEVKYQVVFNIPEGTDVNELNEEDKQMLAMFQPEFYVTEWMTVDAVKIPKSIDMKMGTYNGTITFKKVEFNIPIDAKMFEKTEKKAE